MAKSKTDLLIEISWEVCNKVGGIYTVLASKSYQLCKCFENNVIFVGPDFSDHKNVLFTEDSSVLEGIERYLPAEVKVKKGYWNIPGHPKTLLVDFRGVFPRLNSLYGEMWEKYGVDSLHAYGDYAESCAFAVSAAMVAGAISQLKKKDCRNVIAHFNEWTTGMGLLYLKSYYPTVATVFTTHATSIGRSICGNNKPLYGYLKGYNGDQMAEELNMQSKHSLEKQAAHNADCFTAVSEVTASEAEQLLEIRPQVITPNGFEVEIAGTLNEQKKKRKAGRTRILQVVSALTGKEYPADTVIIGTSGRNEYRNKGLDVFLDAMAHLRDSQSKKNIIALVMVPAWVKEPRGDLEAKIKGDDRVFIADRNLTHFLNNPEHDAINCRIRQLGLNNSQGDLIDVVYVPCYLDGNDGVFNLEYYDLLPALDLTVFPSYYEPWGYTPLESIAFGVPTITTCLSGFGQWVKTTFPAGIFGTTGVGVVNRDDFNYHDTVSGIVSFVESFLGMNKKELPALRNNALATAAQAQWEKFIAYYIDAYKTALKNCKNRNK